MLMDDRFQKENYESLKVIFCSKNAQTKDEILVTRKILVTCKIPSIDEVVDILYVRNSL